MIETIRGYGYRLRHDVDADGPTSNTLKGTPGDGGPDHMKLWGNPGKKDWRDLNPFSFLDSRKQWFYPSTIGSNQNLHELPSSR